MISTGLIRKVLKVSKEHGILGDILNKTVTIKHAEGQEVSYTPFDYTQLCGNSEAVEEILKVARKESILGGILKGKSAIDEQTLLPTAVKETAIKELKDSYTLADIEEAIEECKESLEVKEQEDIPHTETDPQLYKDISKDFQPIFESSEKAQNSSIETATLEPNAPDRPSSTEIEPCFDSGSGKGNSADEKSSKRAIQPILAGVVGAALLVSSVIAYILKMYAIAVIVGIIGLACVSYALYNIINPNTKLEKVEEQSITAHPPLKAI